MVFNFNDLVEGMIAGVYCSVPFFIGFISFGIISNLNLIPVSIGLIITISYILTVAWIVNIVRIVTRDL